MTPELARAALAFLTRCDLKGGEAPMFMAVATALDQIANGTVLDTAPRAKVDSVP